MKTTWIIDGAYLFNVGRTQNFDYLKLKNELVSLNEGPIYETYYLNSSPDPTRDHQDGFHSWLKSAEPKGPRFRVQLYALKEMHNQCPHCRTPFDRQVQKGVDVGIATLIVKLAVQGSYDRLILAAGDGDFEDAINYVKSELKKEVWILGAQASVSTDLQSYSDRVLWLDDLFPNICK